MAKHKKWPEGEELERMKKDFDKMWEEASKPKPIPKGKSRFEWLKVFGPRFKREKKKGETFTQYMKRLKVWK